MNIEKLQDLMIKKNLIIRTLPKEVEHRYKYDAWPETEKAKFDKILKTNPCARIERDYHGIEYIVYKEKTEYTKGCFIVGIKDSLNFHLAYSNKVDPWDWIRENDEIVIFNSLEDIVKYFDK